MSHEGAASLATSRLNPGAALRDRPISLGNIGAMLLLAVIWGFSIPMTKFGLVTLPPLTMTALRFAIAVPVLFLFIARKPLLPGPAMRRLAALGVFGIGIGQITQSLGVARVSASAAAIVSATIPVFIVIFAALRLRQSVSGKQALGLLAAFAGILLVTLGNGGGTAEGGSTLTGICLMTLSALALAFYSVWSVELTGAHGAAQVAAWSACFGFLAFLPLAGWEIWRSPPHLTAGVIGAALYLGLVVTVAGLFLWLHLLRAVPARTAAYVQYLQPVIGIGASSLIFGDRLTLLFGLGVVLVLTGLVLSLEHQRRGSAE